MYALGIDIGTTNLNLSLVDLDGGRIVERRSAPNKRVPSADEYAFQQDPAGIVASVREMAASVSRPVSSICVTGQVHGILYVDADGRPLSPLYNWLDRRGMESVDGTTAQKRLAERTGRTMPVGYGLLTHYANRLLGRVPSGARAILGINEFVTGSLIGRTLDRTDASNLGPLGAFDPVTGVHDRNLLDEILPPGSPAFLSLAPPFELAGTTPSGIPVAHSVGDNQAGFFGLVPRPASTCLISIGTSGQISVFSHSTSCSPTMELRPYLGLGYLHVGATLCAGKAYETLERFFRSVLELSGAGAGAGAGAGTGAGAGAGAGAGGPIGSGDDEAVFRMMAEAASSSPVPSPLIVDTAINGTRADPERRGSIRGIAMDNLTVGNLVRGAVDGIVRELADFRTGTESLFSGLDSIVATGSAVRKNPLFAETLGREFGLELRIPEIDGAAAMGAALIGATAAGTIRLGEVEGLVDALWNNGRRRNE